MLRKMISMERTAPEMAEASSPSYNIPKYDFGLSLRFSQETLDKLDLDTSDVEVGDMIDMRCMGEVTSVSKHDGGDGEKCCVEIQITRIAIENEATEYGDEAD